MLPMLDEERACLPIVDRDTVGAGIYKSRVGVFLNDTNPGPYISTTVVFMPFGSGKFVEVDVVSFENVFEHGP